MENCAFHEKNTFIFYPETLENHYYWNLVKSDLQTTSGPPGLKTTIHGAHEQGTKVSWRDQKAGGPENFLALRAEGI